MTKPTNTLKKILLDIIPVVFGVLIALFIGDLKESYDDQKFLDNMYGTIAKEMQTNTEAVSEVLTNHYTFIDSLNANLDKDVSIAELLQTNFQKANIQNTGWHSFINSKLELVDFEAILILSTLDEVKQSLNLKFDQLMNFVISNLNSSKKEHKETLLILVVNVIDSEESLVRTQEKYLEWYEKEQATSK